MKSGANVMQAPSSVNEQASDDAGWKTLLREAAHPSSLLPPEAVAAAALFPFRAPASFLALMNRDDPEDPIARQILPSPEETVAAPGFGPDPVGDQRFRVAPGLIHKYPGRALLVLTSACAVHCRYCFRRSFPYGDEDSGGRAAEEALEAIAADSSLAEVILSGGDPLVLPDEVLSGWVQRLGRLSHLKRLRIHTRVPGVLPQRITSSLLTALKGPLPLWVVVHFNHPRELTPQAVEACGRLVDAGFPLLNQAVLLRGVNDDAQILAELLEGLVNVRIKPYYLHQMDRVAGGAHFEVPEQEGLRLMEAVRERVSGLAMPMYVRDLPGESSKVPIGLPGIEVV